MIIENKINIVPINSFIGKKKFNIKLKNPTVIKPYIPAIHGSIFERLLSKINFIKITP